MGISLTLSKKRQPKYKEFERWYTFLAVNYPDDMQGQRA